MGAQELIACFQDTVMMSRQDVLAEETARAAASSTVYKEGFSSGRLYPVSETVVQILEGTTFETAKKYLQHGKVAVLNFANPHFPGGGVRNGAMAQEECLCRSSNLYACLSDAGVAEDYYQYHRKNTDYFFSDRLIYTKDITIFKDDSMIPELLPVDQWFQTDVITCAAPYIAKRKYTNHAALKQTFMSRIRNILEAAIENEVDVLILGAFGCGAFKNPPEVVSGAFRSVLQENRYRGAFRRVVFAIKSTVGAGAVCPNLAAFRNSFSDAAPNPGIIGGDVRVPGGRILREGPENMKYQQWKTQNPYYGKQFSILGDSVSTLEGFNPRGYNVFYQGDICQRAGVSEMKDTWWGKVIDFLGGELLVNNAWSGSLVSRNSGQKEAFPSGCSQRRTGQLHIGGINPDVILVYMGINDWINGIPVRKPGGDDTIFAVAYSKMLADLKNQYPDTQIWCCTLNETYKASDPGFAFPVAPGGTDIRMYNRTIGECARKYGCHILDLHSHGIPCDSIDGTHPTVQGMDTLAVAVIRSMTDAAGAAFLDCDAGRHDNLEIPSDDGNFRYICKRCGHVYLMKHEERTPAAAAVPVFESPKENVLQLYIRETGQTVRFRGERVFAGRSRDCDLRLTSGYAARYQATFTCREGVWYIRDNNSKNGTYLNGTRLDPGMDTKLKADDEITFAKQEPVVFRPVGK